MRRGWGFLFLVAFFTVFGAGKSHYWEVVAVDQSGWTYAVDLYSISPESSRVISCKMLAVHQDGEQVVERWRLDAEQSELVRSSVGKVEPISDGSVAQRAIVFFRKRGDLPYLGGLVGNPAR